MPRPEIEFATPEEEEAYARKALTKAGVPITQYEAIREHKSRGGTHGAGIYTKEMLEDDFHGMSIEVLAYQHIQLNEGKFHEGPADVIRMIATKL